MGTGTKQVYIGSYDEERNWWEGQAMYKKIKGSVLTVILNFLYLILA